MIYKDIVFLLINISYCNDGIPWYTHCITAVPYCCMSYSSVFTLYQVYHGVDSKKHKIVVER